MSEPRDPLNPLNSSFTGAPALGDGVALTSTAHPIDVSEAMIAAARSAIKGWSIDATDEILAMIYCAMVGASPLDDRDIDPDSLETIEIEIPDLPGKILDTDRAERWRSFRDPGMFVPFDGFVVSRPAAPCGCAGEFHNGGCSDQNVVWWAGFPGGVPVYPTPEQIAEQGQRRQLGQAHLDRLMVAVPAREAMSHLFVDIPEVYSTLQRRGYPRQEQIESPKPHPAQSELDATQPVPAIPGVPPYCCVDCGEPAGSWHRGGCLNSDEGVVRVHK